ncbi:hypothetical protein B0T21DRAFT_345955 [Apiosordaria backusii]|uniref:Uncharacterized protein n=1 Tax=Apiosordaria backusii TaxID=314023 RepID=A0AA40EMM4_9PEZI|nr:hypothetical protein B0T21DRAFT_345955 [Apiosordaria backusii]
MARGFVVVASEDDQVILEPVQGSSPNSHNTPYSLNSLTRHRAQAELGLEGKKCQWAWVALAVGREEPCVVRVRAMAGESEQRPLVVYRSVRSPLIMGSTQTIDHQFELESARHSPLPTLVTRLAPRRSSGVLPSALGEDQAGIGFRGETKVHGTYPSAISGD